MRKLLFLTLSVLFVFGISFSQVPVKRKPKKQKTEQTTSSEIKRQREVESARKAQRQREVEAQRQREAEAQRQREVEAQRQREADIKSNQKTSNNANKMSGGDTNTQTPTRPAVKRGYNRISLSYECINWMSNYADEFGEGKDNLILNGFGLDYIHGFGLSKTLPMFIETGIKGQIGFGSFYYNGRKQYSQQLSFSVPVNYTYKFYVGNRMSIAPYLGISFKVNAMIRGCVKSGDWYDYDGMKRFQMGSHIGVGLNWKKLYAGIQYEIDFLPIDRYYSQYYDETFTTNTGTFSFSIGLNL